MSTPTTALPERAPLTARGLATRTKILASAEYEFGRKGFHAASVSSITQHADVGQGTFYLYFYTKEEIFQQLVARITETLLDLLNSSRDAAALRAALVHHASQTPGQDRILREAEFVDAPAWHSSRRILLETVARKLGGSGAQEQAAMLLGGMALVASVHRFGTPLAQ